MPEKQNTEYKQGWHDDYLERVCGFANAIWGLLFFKRASIEDYRK